MGFLSRKLPEVLGASTIEQYNKKSKENDRAKLAGRSNETAPDSTPASKSSSARSRVSDGPGIQRERGRLVIDTSQGRRKVTGTSAHVTEQANAVIESFNNGGNGKAALREQGKWIEELKQNVGLAMTRGDKVKAERIKNAAEAVQDATRRYAKNRSSRNHKALEKAIENSNRVSRRDGKS